MRFFQSYTVDNRTRFGNDSSIVQCNPVRARWPRLKRSQIYVLRFDLELAMEFCQPMFVESYKGAMRLRACGLEWNSVLPAGLVSRLASPVHPCDDVN